MTKQYEEHKKQSRDTNQLRQEVTPSKRNHPFHRNKQNTEELVV